MTQRCTRCQRANPAEANYCYFDGFVLAGHGGASGPVAVGSQAFPNAFVFPSGRSCRSFNELALACQEEWASAGDLLQKGYLESFLGGLGRIDLAMAAKEASKFPDRDRALDQLLSKLPSDTLEAPALRCEPQEVSLGVLTGDTEERFDLRLENQGMRLLYGSVTTDAPWLILGDGSVGREKHFQCTHEQTIPIRIANEFLRAGPKPIEARLAVESNGGSAAIVVRVERPVKPFPPGLFGGARTPRQVALTAKAQAKEAAPLFERGEVADWYRSNGWTYPVQGPPASGLGAIQQFFEALGLVAPPKVDISVKAIRLEGMPGDRLTGLIEVRTQEKRPVYAHGVSDQPWLVAERARLKGQTATLNLVIDVPDNPGEELTARLTVQSNGNQRFVVTVRLKVGGQKLTLPSRRRPEPEPVLQAVGAGGNEFAAMVADEPAPAPRSNRVSASAVVDLPLEDLSSPAAVTTLETAPSTMLETSPRGRGGMSRYRRNKGAPVWMHLFPAGVLVAAVLGVVGFDLFRGPSQADSAQKQDDALIAENDQKAGGTKPVDPPRPPPQKGIVFKLGGRKPLLNLRFSDRGSFGLTMADQPDPNNPDKFKKIIYDETGATNNTIVMIDRFEHEFGKLKPGTVWIAPSTTARPRVVIPGDRDGSDFKMEFQDGPRAKGIQVQQHVELVPGADGQIDTCLVWYTVTNASDSPHTVGLRIMLDTYIGARDDVPFTIPGEKSFLDTRREFKRNADSWFKTDEIPDYVEAIENPETPANLGTTARMQIKGIHLPDAELEAPDRLYIGAFPGQYAKWDDFILPENQKDIKEAKDSCVVLFWRYRRMEKGEVRHFGFTYGLSEMALPRQPTQPNLPPEAQPTLMALRAPASVQPDKEFTLTAYVWNGEKGQKVSLALPGEFEFAGGDKADKVLEEGGKRQLLSWKVKVKTKKDGLFSIEATTRKAGEAQEVKTKRDIAVKQNSIFG